MARAPVHIPLRPTHGAARPKSVRPRAVCVESVPRQNPKTDRTSQTQRESEPGLSCVRACERLLRCSSSSSSKSHRRKQPTVKTGRKVQRGRRKGSDTGSRLRPFRSGSGAPPRATHPARTTRRMCSAAGDVRVHCYRRGEECIIRRRSGDRSIVRADPAECTVVVCQVAAVVQYVVVAKPSPCLRPTLHHSRN